MVSWLEGEYKKGHRNDKDNDNDNDNDNDKDKDNETDNTDNNMFNLPNRQASRKSSQLFNSQYQFQHISAMFLLPRIIGCQNLLEPPASLNICNNFQKQ